MIALAVTNTNTTLQIGNWVYGLFVKDDASFATNNGHWTSLKSVSLGTNEEITAVGTFNGNLTWIGTTKCQIFSLASSTTTPWTANAQLSIPRPSNGRIIDLAFANDDVGWAITDSGFLYRMRRNADNFPIWEQLPNPTDFGHRRAPYRGYTALAVLRRNPDPILFVADYTDIWSTTDDGVLWTNISGVETGLPLWAGCMDLSAIVEEVGAAYLYLATYGHSIYRKLLNSPDPQTTDLRISGEMGFTVRDTFGDDEFNPAIPLTTFTLSALHPYDEFEVVESLQHLSARLRITMAMKSARTVLIRFFVDFNNGQVKREKSFILERFVRPIQHTNAEWADGDGQIDVNFDVRV